MSEEYPEYAGGEEPGYEGDGPNIRFDEFVERIVQDPNDPPGVTLLSGYLGSSSEEACVRLYLDEELSRYVEIPEKAIRHTQELPPEQSPLGGSLVWIDRDAEVLHGAAGSERQRATFLEGQIAQDYMGAAPGAAYAGLSGSTQTRECILHPSAYGPTCGTSRSGPCIPQTEFGCRTRTGILCTRLGPNCGRTSYDPACTIAGPHCRTLVFFQCQQSVAFPCVTHDIECQASGYVPCNPPIDFTIWQGQYVAEANFGTKPTGNPCLAPPPTVFCQPPTSILTCRSLMACQHGPGAGVRMHAQQTQTKECGETQYCPTAYCAQPTVACPTHYRCPSQFSACPTYYPCPSQFSACQSQLNVCPSAVDACPTRYHCPTLPPGCPDTRFGACETFGACPSAVDACPTRFGCQTRACAAVPPQTHSNECQTHTCPSRLVYCPTQPNQCSDTRYICGETVFQLCAMTEVCGSQSPCQTQAPSC